MPRALSKPRVSALFRHLSQELWEEYHNKQDAFGVSFKACILSGCQNPDASLGCFAGSADSYEAFSKFFDRVLEEACEFGPEK